MELLDMANEHQGYDEDFELLAELEDESDPLGIILAYDVATCW